MTTAKNGSHMAFRPYKQREYGSTCDVVSRLLDQSGGAKHAAFLLDRSTTQAQSYSDPQTPDQISFDQVRRLTDATGAVAAAEDLAALADGVFTPLGPSEELLAVLLAKGETEHGKFLPRLVQQLGAHGAGQLGDVSRVALLKDLDAMIRAFVAARSKLAAARAPPDAP